MKLLYSTQPRRHHLLGGNSSKNHRLIAIWWKRVRKSRPWCLGKAESRSLVTWNKNEREQRRTGDGGGVVTIYTSQTATILKWILLKVDRGWDLFGVSFRADEFISKLSIIVTVNLNKTTSVEKTALLLKLKQVLQGTIFCGGRILSRKCSKSNSLSWNCIQYIFISSGSAFLMR